MASKRKSADLPINYRQLNEFSSVVLFDTTPRKKRGRLYDVERIIARRRIPCVVKWLISNADLKIYQNTRSSSSGISGPLEASRLMVLGCAPTKLLSSYATDVMSSEMMVSQERRHLRD